VCAPPAPSGSAASGAHGPDLADIVHAHGSEVRRRHRLAAVQERALRAIATCRTAARGGHVERCDRCGATRAVYHSCRNRHCPRCQTLAQQRWLEARRKELLPIEYFHVVFTLPHELNRFAQHRPRVIYRLLFQAAAETLQAFARDPKHLGGELGITAVLHTWGQNLSQHIHLHCVVTGGALAPDGSRWIAARRGFLFPVRALSKVFRGKYLEGLQRAFEQGQLPCEECVAHLVRILHRQSWVVYAKRPFAGPEQVLAYLGQYTHRIAISNHRIVGLRDGIVRFRWRDYANGNRSQVMELSAVEFLRRFLLHVLPTGFVRIRHFGLFANRSRRDKLQHCRELHGKTPSEPERPRETVEAMIRRLTGLDLCVCPVCHEGRMTIAATLAPGDPPPPNVAVLDTS
jgi:hypothetical protein